MFITMVPSALTGAPSGSPANSITSQPSAPHAIDTPSSGDPDPKTPLAKYANSCVATTLPAPPGPNTVTVP